MTIPGITYSFMAGYYASKNVLSLMTQVMLIFQCSDYPLDYVWL